MPIVDVRVSAVADLAQTAADGAIGQRHLQEAASTGLGQGLMSALGTAASQP